MRVFEVVDAESNASVVKWNAVLRQEEIDLVREVDHDTGWDRGNIGLSLRLSHEKIDVNAITAEAELP